MNILRKALLCAVLLALLLPGCIINSNGTMTVSPACDSATGTVTPEFQNTWMSWQGIAFLAGSTIFIVSILAYTLGYALMHRKVIMWAKEQMQEACLSMVIVLFVIGLVSFLCSLDLRTLGMEASCICTDPTEVYPACTTGSSCNFVDAGYGMLMEMYKIIMYGFLTLTAMQALLASVSTITIGLAPGGIGIIFNPFGMAGDIASSLRDGMIVLMISAIFTLTQMVLLKMTESLFVILFPIGIILRSFGATRGFGGGLIAIAIGFFLLYPLLVILFYGSVLGSIQTDYNSMTTSMQGKGLDASTSNWFGGDMLSSVVGFVGKTILGALFIPLLMFMILVAFVKGLSTALGEEVDVSNLTRLI
ncbi:MAG: hypothetical protein NT130_04885 [Candidatus Micrarchaeota archaeon]|nr:hypothetical protein [Candidatus Micrarchaeota archaeon]